VPVLDEWMDFAFEGGDDREFYVRWQSSGVPLGLGSPSLDQARR
jgi:hypothetical protein